MVEATDQSGLSSRYEPRAIEDAALERWDKGGYSRADAAAPGEPYSIVIPPPNVTGYLHIGHALNNTLQDILTRWRRMQGRNTLWLPGTDHAGIATQHVVARELWKNEKLDWRALGREKFLERVWQWKEQYGSRIVRQLKRLGCSCDWSRERFTMDAGLSRAVMTVFKKLYEEGLIYRGDYLVNWSTKLQTALSDDEVVYKEIHGHLWHLRYPLEDGSGFVQVATTRPETMLGDTAVAVHPDDERYASLHAKKVRLPLTGRLAPIIADGMVDRAFGTGAVKVTPAHDPNDYEMGKRHGLEFINILNPDGTLIANAGPFAGLEVAEARKQVVAALEAEGALVTIEDHVHSVGHDYRTGCVIEPYLSKQWFVKMGPLVGPAIEAVKSGRVQFVPSHHDSVYFHWMENVRDWCISRQLWWGHRIPIYECGDCGHLVCEIENAPEQCAKCGGLNMKQDPDVLDTWFSSALWPFSTLGWPDETADLKTYYPTTVLVTAHEIIFFWVARMIIMGLKFMNEVPFKQVVINPLVMDERGKKMSKSSGTAIDPLEVIEQYGTDAIRLTLASYPTQSRHISLSEKRFESWRNFNNKLWNAARFVLMNTQDLPADALAGGLGEEDLQLEDRWILHALSKTIEATTNALESFEFDKFIETIYRFTWNRYCDWYLELVKDRLYGNDRADEHVRFGAASRRAAQIVLVTVLEHTLRLLHPAAPFISEEIWQQVRDRFKMGNAGGAEGRAADTRRALEAGSIMMAPWPETARRPPSQQALMREMSDYDTMDRAVKTIGCLRTIRGEMNVPPATATDIVISTEEATHRMDLQNTEHYVRSLVSVGNIRYEIEPDASVFASTGVFEDVTIQVLLPESLRAEERARLDKEMGKLERGVQGSEAKLANPSFAGNAPETVVFKERKRLEQMQTELASLRERRAALE